MVRDGRMTLLSIYIDEDVAEWFKGLSDYPEEWITGYNQDLTKKILFKDISPNMLMLQLERL